MVNGPSPSTVGKPVNLGQFRYHTGAQPSPLAPGENCPPLFRDVGFEAMARFLRGSLRDLCGPYSPVTYLRTADYREPYIDHGRIGRIMLIQPRSVGPWRSGIDPIFIAPRNTKIDFETMIFIPSEISLRTAADKLAGARNSLEAREALGGREYLEARAETLDRLDWLARTHEESEQLAGPLRRMFQSPDRAERQRAREGMQGVGLSESDLCTAWHHLPDDRREHFSRAIQELRGMIPC